MKINPFIKKTDSFIWIVSIISENKIIIYFCVEKMVFIFSPINTLFGRTNVPYIFLHHDTKVFFHELIINGVAELNLRVLFIYLVY